MTRVGLGVLVSVLTVGCGAGSLGEVISPDAMTASKALGERAAPSEVPDFAEPLVVDWSGQQRLDLELAMKQGVAVVAYTPERFELLRRCRVMGDYRFAGVSRKEEVIKLESADEVAANLPLSSVTIQASLERGSSIDLGLVMIGKRSTSVPAVARPMLQGKCDGATHFVQAATVGGFAMDQGVVGKARAAAEIFGAGTSGSSDHSEERSSKDGDLKACRAASSDAAAPPDQCQAALRLDLAPIVAHVSSEVTPAAFAMPTAQQIAASCPEGMTRVGGKCTASVRSCADMGVDACEARCAEGDDTSCLILGDLYRFGDGVERDLDRAVDHYANACEAGQLVGCLAAGRAVDDCFESGPAPPGLTCDLFTPATSTAWLLTACDGGVAAACNSLALRPKNLRSHTGRTRYALQRRGCDLGSKASCAALGRLFRDGVGGAPKDEKAATTVLRRACFGGHEMACRSLAGVYRGRPHFSGAGDPPPARGRELAEVQAAACQRGDGKACWEAGNLFDRGAPGVVRNRDRALRFFELACQPRNTWEDACRRAGQLHIQFTRRLDDALRMYARACEDKGVLCENGANVAQRQRFAKLHAACEAGDGVACDHFTVVMLEEGCGNAETADADSCRRLESRDERAARRAYRTHCEYTGWQRQSEGCRAYLRVGGELPRPSARASKGPSQGRSAVYARGPR